MLTVALANAALVAIAVVLAAGMLRPRLRNARAWRATVTPLASIIGSGFLVVAPLLGEIAGGWATLAMALVVALAYAIGTIIRFNIRHAEPRLARPRPGRALRLTEDLANLLLSLAYLVSVAFYVRLLSAFALRGVGLDSEIGARWLTTAILGFIGLHGWRRGLRGLERLEEYSVTIKLAIIGALLAGLVGHALTEGYSLAALPPVQDDALGRLRRLAGILLVVQGFETSRYLGGAYSTNLRIRSMRAAQWLSGAIYIGFIALATPLLGHLASGPPNETAIIDLSAYVAAVLPAMLVVAALMSQFSAAVADTLGAGGLLHEESRGRVRPAHGYAVVAASAILLIWTADIFEIIALASRAFAAYYLCQALVALQVNRGLRPGGRRWVRYGWFGGLAAVLGWIVVFAVPAG